MPLSGTDGLNRGRLALSEYRDAIGIPPTIVVAEAKAAIFTTPPRPNLQGEVERREKPRVVYLGLWNDAIEGELS